jgi:hypothetical protein
MAAVRDSDRASSLKNWLQTLGVPQNWLLCAIGAPSIHSAHARVQKMFDLRVTR